MDLKKFSCSVVQSRISTPPPMATATAREMRGAAYMSARFNLMPVTSSPKRSSRAASCIATIATRRSYSYMPTDKRPLTSNARMRGTTPNGVTSPSATSNTTRSPSLTPSSRARSSPRITWYAPALRSLKLPLSMCEFRSTTFSSASGITPRTARRRNGRRAQHFLEAVHHRQHDDQDGDAEHQSGNGDAGYQRDQAAARRGAQIAKADEPLVPVAHHS